MRKPKLEKFDAAAHREKLSDSYMNAVASQKMEQSDWQKRRRSKVLQRIYGMACKRLKISRQDLGQRVLALSNSRTRAIQRVTEGEIPRFEKWLLACELANIPRIEAAVLWARESIPDHFSEYKKYVGVTLKRRKLRELTYQKNPTEDEVEAAREAYAFMVDEVGLQYGAKALPESPQDLHRLAR